MRVHGHISRTLAVIVGRLLLAWALIVFSLWGALRLGWWFFELVRGAGENFCNGFAICR